MTIYLAGPLFTAAERAWNASLAQEFRKLDLTVVLPQEEAATLISCTGAFIPSKLYENCLSGIDRSDAVVAILDGADCDSGTSFECGYAVARAKQVVGLRTDLRKTGDDADAGVNLMLSVAATPVQASCLDPRWDLPSLCAEVVRRLRA